MDRRVARSALPRWSWWPRARGRSGTRSPGRTGPGGGWRRSAGGPRHRL